jgi:hypothetical protein
MRAAQCSPQKRAHQWQHKKSADHVQKLQYTLG